MELLRNVDETKRCTPSKRSFEIHDDYFSDWWNQGTFRSCCKNLPKWKYVFHKQIFLISTMNFTLQAVYSASVICLDPIPDDFLDLVESLTTWQLFWIFTNFVNWMKVPKVYTNDADLPTIGIKDLRILKKKHKRRYQKRPPCVLYEDLTSEVVIYISC